jgi:glycosyltransferase involved in cell wall biosynthesis
MKVTTALKGLSPYQFIGNYDSYSYIDTLGETKQMSASTQQAAFVEMVGKIVESLEFDIIHAHDWLTFRAALLAREKSGKPLILHVHSIESDRSGGQGGNPIVREIEKTSMLLADHVIAVSHHTKNCIIRDYHIPADKIEVVHNSLDRAMLEHQDEDNAYKYLQDMKKQGWSVVANVGRLTIQKGLPHLMGAAARVVRLRPKTLFLLVGDGEQRDELIEMAAEFGIAKNVIFAGFQRGKNWRDAYKIADLFVMPSISEPFGLTPFEATAYSTPSLISKQSGVSEIFKSCLKVDFWDEQEMANKMLAALNSPGLTESLIDNAKLEYERLSWSHSADKIMRRYQQFRQKVAT